MGFGAFNIDSGSVRSFFARPLEFGTRKATVETAKKQTAKQVLDSARSVFPRFDRSMPDIHAAIKGTPNTVTSKIRSVKRTLLDNGKWADVESPVKTSLVKLELNTFVKRPTNGEQEKRRNDSLRTVMSSLAKIEEDPAMPGHNRLVDEDGNSVFLQQTICEDESGPIRLVALQNSGDVYRVEAVLDKERAAGSHFTEARLLSMMNDIQEFGRTYYPSAKSRASALHVLAMSKPAESVSPKTSRLSEVKAVTELELSDEGKAELIVNEVERLHAQGKSRGEVIAEISGMYNFQCLQLPTKDDVLTQAFKKLQTTPWHAAPGPRYEDYKDPAYADGAFEWNRTEHDASKDAALRGAGEELKPEDLKATADPKDFAERRRLMQEEEGLAHKISLGESRLETMNQELGPIKNAVKNYLEMTPQAKEKRESLQQLEAKLKNKPAFPVGTIRSLRSQARDAVKADEQELNDLRSWVKDYDGYRAVAEDPEMRKRRSALQKEVNALEDELEDMHTSMAEYKKVE